MTSPVTGSDVNTTDSVRAPEGCLVIPFSVFTPWNQPEDLVSHATQQAFNKFANVYMLTILLFISVPCNLVNLVVFWNHGLRERINLCLFCLAFADLMTVLPHFVWNLDGLYSELAGTRYQLTVMKVCVNSMIHSLAGFIYVSGFLCTLIALERCLCVWSPLKAQRVIQTRTAAIIIAAGHVFILGGHHVIATKWRVECMFDPLTGQVVEAFYSSAFYLNNKALVDFTDGIVFGILLPGSFLAGVMISTIITVLKLKEMAEWREKSSSVTSAGTGSTTKDVTLTRMLIGTSCLFILCTTPPLIFHTAVPFVPDLSLSGKFYNAYYLFINMQQLLTYINTSVNFFIYYIFGTKFRHSVQAMFCKSVGGSGKLRQKVNNYSNLDPQTGTSSVSQTAVVHRVSDIKVETDTQ